jgi:hypothetical protein
MSSQNDAITSWLRLTASSNRIPHPYWTYKSVQAHLYAVLRQTGVAALYSYTHPIWPRFRCSRSHVKM